MRTSLKRTIAIFLCCFYFVALVSASNSSQASSSPGVSSAVYEDSFAFLAQNKEYVELYDAIYNCKEPAVVEKCYANLENSLGTSAQDWMTLLKGALNGSYYYLDIATKKNSKRAKELISYAYKIYEELKKFGIDEKLLLPIHFCCLTMDYLAHPMNFAKGIEAIDVIDDAYKKYPNELTIANLYASRKLNAPSIGGGNVSEAIEIYKSLIAFFENSEPSSSLGDGTSSLKASLVASPWEMFDTYSNIAKGYIKQKDNKSALLYYNKALEIYPQNKVIQNAIKEMK